MVNIGLCTAKTVVVVVIVLAAEALVEAPVEAPTLGRSLELSLLGGVRRLV